MKQHASRLFLILTTALLFLGTTGFIQSQPVLRLMGSQTLTSIYEGMRCGISITESGNVLAWWREVSGRDTPPKGSQWLTTVGEKLDIAMPDPDTVSCFHYVTDTLWSGLFFTREDLTTVGIWSTVLKIQFCRGTGDTVEDTSDVFASAGEWVRHDANIDSWAMDEFLAARGDTLFFAISEKFSGFNAIPVGGLAFRLDRWVAGEKEVFSLHEHNEHKFSWFSDQIYDLMRVSAPREGVSVIYKRSGAGREASHIPDSMYYEDLLLIDLSRAQLIDSNRIGTTLPKGCNATPRLLPPIGNTVDLLRNDRTNTKLSVDRYTLDGVRVDHKLLIDGIRMTSPPITQKWDSTLSQLDFDVVVLDDDSRVISWSMPVSGDDGDVFVTMFDKHWRQTGMVARIHEETAGMQYEPVLAVHGDTIAVAWKSQTASGFDSLYIGFFVRDQILAAEPVLPAQPDLQVSQPWPIPAKSSFAMHVRVPQVESVVVLECRDLLGRIVHRSERSTTTGQLRFHEDISRLLPGIYLISVRSGDQTVKKKLIVE